MPKVSGSSQSLVIGFHLAESGRTENRKIWFPFLEGEAALPRLEVATRNISAGDFGLTLQPREPLGNVADLKRFPLREYIALCSTYTELLSEIIDRSWLLGDTSVSRRQGEMAHRTNDVLSQILERALEPYYRVVAAPLRQWIRHCLPQ
jgi:hypothetical protein